MRLLLFLITFSLSWSALAELNLNLQRRLAVFPIGENSSSMAEDAWWQMRELLTKDQKFLVASKRFMMNRGVFQPRKALKAADVIILSKILDAEALITSWVEGRRMLFKVYEAESGACIWEGEGEFHPAISISDQLIKVSLRLVGDFLSALPYQSFQVIDDVYGKPVYEQDAKKFAQVFIGPQNQVLVGDSVQWITVAGDATLPLLNNAPRITVIAEGKVTKLMPDRAEVEIEKMRNPDELIEKSLVRFPKEMNRLKDLYTREDRVSTLGSEYLSGEMKTVSEFQQEAHPTATALAFILNIAGMILLAF